MKTIKPILLSLLLLAAVPFYTYSQNAAKIKPAKLNAFIWGYQDLLGGWVITPQFSKAAEFTKDNIAIIGIADFEIKQHPVIGAVMSTNDIHTALYPKEFGLIDLNGNILVKYKYNATQKQKDKKYDKALKIVAKRNANGVYNDIYAKLTQAESINNQRILQVQREQAKKDSILLAQKEQKRRADSISSAKKMRADSIRLVQEIRINAMPSQGQGISLRKIKVTGHGLLLSKDKTVRQYTIRLDDFNRILVTYEGDTRVRAELDVLKAIYESNWGLLSDDLFQSVEIVKATTEISQGVRSKKFGIFSFLFTLNLDDLDKVFTDEKTLLTVQNSIFQVEKYVLSFMNHYQSAAYFVEPLFQVKVGGMEGISVGIVDKRGAGKDGEAIEIGNAKRMCAEARKKLDAERIN